MCKMRSTWAKNEKKGRILSFIDTFIDANTCHAQRHLGILLIFFALTKQIDKLFR